MAPAPTAMYQIVKVVVIVANVVNIAGVGLAWWYLSGHTEDYDHYLTSSGYNLTQPFKDYQGKLTTYQLYPFRVTGQYIFMVVVSLSSLVAILAAVVGVQFVLLLHGIASVLIGIYVVFNWAFQKTLVSAIVLPITGVVEVVFSDRIQAETQRLQAMKL